MSPEIPPDPPVASQSTVIPPRPWGFWATIGWSLIIAIAYLGIQFLAGIIIAIVSKDIASLNAEEFATNGMLLAIMTCFAAPVVVGLCVLFASLRKQYPLKNYLGFHWPAIRTIRRWSIGLLTLILASDALTSLLGRLVVPDFMLEIYETAGNAMPLLWLALIVAAPFSEEFLFRGFLFTGLKESRLGAYGTILFTSLIWASIHGQYDLYGITTIFAAGIFLGFARLKTNSIWLCVFLHGLMNLIATLQTVAHRAFL